MTENEVMKILIPLNEIVMTGINYDRKDRTSNFFFFL